MTSTTREEQMLALSRATAAGAPAGTVGDAWRTGAAAEVPVGRTWDVLRVTATVGSDALNRLRCRNIALGPVLDVRPRGTVEFLVAPGLASYWPDLRCTVWADRGFVRWPAPSLSWATGRRARCGRSWVVPPSCPSPYTADADALCEAVVASLLDRIHEAERLWPSTGARVRLRGA
ncbi:hypothetical protein [Streptomyces albus]|uniref:hypothetical protein n=1 Tax=Streptomyces albus TaxID=1888 RepID=UPI00069113B2|nr:hypothetical protein [Streptomyces albus]